MNKNYLTGIERELVLQYLADANVPVTITEIKEKSEEKNSDENKIEPLSSSVFPVALQAEHISVLKEGIILLKNSDKSLSNLLEKDVKVEFYFNRVGLFFNSKIKKVKAGFALVIPSQIQRIQDVEKKQKYDFKATLFFLDSENKKIELYCVPADNFSLFSRPVWSSIQLDKQKKAKEYLENFVEQARNTKKAGNGIQLVNICRYLTQDSEIVFEAIQGRIKPFDILFINHERIVLGFENNDSVKIEEEKKYELKLSFILKENSLVTRDILVTCQADILYSDENKTKFCADCSFINIKEEDTRFLYEKATSLLFI